MVEVEKEGRNKRWSAANTGSSVVTEISLVNSLTTFRRVLSDCE